MAEADYDTIAREDCPHTEMLDEGVTAGQERTTCRVCDEEEHMRVCLTCGRVHCCESGNAHDRDHFEETDHPFIRPHEKESYDFLWCYACEAYLT